MSVPLASCGNSLPPSIRSPWHTLCVLVPLGKAAVQQSGFLPGDFPFSGESPTVKSEKTFPALWPFLSREMPHIVPGRTGKGQTDP